MASRLVRYKDPDTGRILVRRETPRWKIIVFVKGERKTKCYWDPKEAQAKVDAFAEKGYKAHVVCRRHPKFPPKGEPEDSEQLWCPYCRRWRYFAVPKSGVFFNLGLKCCRWCSISEEDAYVKKFNGTWNGRPQRKRRKKNRDRK